MPRPKLPYKTARLDIYLPEDLLDKVRLLFFDPTTNKTRYGVLSALVAKLLREWLERKEKGLNGLEHD